MDPCLGLATVLHVALQSIQRTAILERTRCASDARGSSQPRSMNQISCDNSLEMRTGSESDDKLEIGFRNSISFMDH